MKTTPVKYLRIGTQNLSDVLSGGDLDQWTESREGASGLKDWQVTFHLRHERPGDAIAYLCHLVGEKAEIEVRAENAPRGPDNPGYVGQGILEAVGETPYTIVGAGGLTEVNTP